MTEEERAVATLAPHEPDYAAIAVAEDFARRHSRMVVSDASSYAGALQTLQEVRTLTKGLDASRKERTQPIDAEKRRIMDAYRPALDALAEADSLLTSVTGKWSREQEMARRKAEAEAAAKAERERQRAEAKAEQYREQGREAKAEEWESKARFTPAPVVPSNIPKVAGVSTRKVWRFEVVDKTKLPMTFLVPNEKAIQALVDSLKDDHGLGDAIRVWTEEVAVTRRLS